MKKIALIIFGLSVFTHLWPQSKKSNIKISRSRSVSFSGKIIGKDSVQLTAIFYRDFPTNGSPEILKVTSDNLNRFVVTFRNVEHLGRVQLIASEGGRFISIEPLPVEPGDNIHLLINLSKQNRPLPFTANITGKNAAKYNCIQEMQSFSVFGTGLGLKDMETSLKIADSILIQRLAILMKYRNKLHPKVYQIIKADIAGEVLEPIMKMKSYDYTPAAQNELWQQEINHIGKLLSKAKPISEEAMSLSPQYVEFIYNMAKAKLVFKYQGKHFDFAELYTVLRSSYKSSLREKVLAFSLFANGGSKATYSSPYSINSNNYRQCLQDASSLFTISYLKKAVTEQLRLAKGTDAFNFILPVDSSNRKLSLKELRGKVILLDMWGYTCTACYLFTTAFHEKIYPLFKDNPNFAVVSIMLGEADEDHYIHRLRNQDVDGTPISRGEHSIMYTSTDNINLFGGKDIANARELESYYNIGGYPYILLIDKRGKIYSSSVPFFQSSDDPNVAKLIELINEALAEQ